MMSLETEVKVLEAAVRWFREDEDRYTPDWYLADGDDEEITPGREVATTCAIGGVEQAVWLTTGKVLTDEDRHLAYVGRRGSEEAPETAVRAEHKTAYWRVMRRLNVEAVRRGDRGDYDKYLGAPETSVGRVADVEDVTQMGRESDTFREMMGVFEAALRQAKAELAKQREENSVPVLA
jgi:hypothetical protein